MHTLLNNLIEKKKKKRHGLMLRPKAWQYQYGMLLELDINDIILSGPKVYCYFSFRLINSPPGHDFDVETKPHRTQ